MTCPCSKLTGWKKALAIGGLATLTTFGGWFGAYKAGWVSSCCPIDSCVKSFQGSTP